jgi:cytochrome c oxidase subunit 5a
MSRVKGMTFFRPTLDELGILTPEEMGYDKPELALPNPYDIH